MLFYSKWQDWGIGGGEGRSKKKKNRETGSTIANI